MSDRVTFFHNPMSRGRIVHWMLEECGAPYDVKVLDFEKREHKTPEYLAINPMGKIPAIVHRGTVVTEAAAICAYLADAFPQAGLAPSTSDPARGTYYRWMFFGAGCLEPALVDKLSARPPAQEGASGYGTYDNTVAAAYPPMYVTAGLNDPRVSYHEPAKWVAKMRALPTGPRPLLFKCELGAGHGGPSGRYDRWRDEARVNAFLLRVLS